MPLRESRLGAQPSSDPEPRQTSEPWPNGCTGAWLQYLRCKGRNLDVCNLCTSGELLLATVVWKAHAFRPAFLSAGPLILRDFRPPPGQDAAPRDIRIACRYAGRFLVRRSSLTSARLEIPILAAVPARAAPPHLFPRCSPGRTVEPFPATRAPKAHRSANTGRSM